MSMRLGYDFFHLDAVSLAPQVLGKYLVRRFETGITESFMITETEAYMGEDDMACHASKGRTSRTEIMYARGGFIYVYLIYGMHWMFNIVAGKDGYPQAVLIRGLKNINGPGRLTRKLEIDRSFYGEDLHSSSRIWLEDSLMKPSFTSTPRIGIDYAGEWKYKKWRFVVLD